MKNRICSLFNIEYPIIQAGMVWCSGYKLASAVSNAGGLGILGAGSMDPDLLTWHIAKCRTATEKPFAVNIPLMYKHAWAMVEAVSREKVQIVFTSAGNPCTYTAALKEQGITVVHVVSSLKFALKAIEANVDAIVGEGFEAGGHNGREETTTFCLIPMLKEHTSRPIIAAGGIASGRSMLAAFNLGAEGVQIGTRFAAAEESSAHEAFKNKILTVKEGETRLSLKKLTPVRLITNRFYEQVAEAESRGASAEELSELLGRNRSRRGMFEGDLDEGELEIGQASALINKLQPAAQIIQEIWNDFQQARLEILNWDF